MVLGRGSGFLPTYLRILYALSGHAPKSVNGWINHGSLGPRWSMFPAQDFFSQNLTVTASTSIREAVIQYVQCTYIALLHEEYEPGGQA